MGAPVHTCHVINIFAYSGVMIMHKMELNSEYKGYASTTSMRNKPVSPLGTCERARMGVYVTWNGQSMKKSRNFNSQTR